MIEKKKPADEWGVWFLLNLSDAWVGGGRCIETPRAAISIAAPAPVISVAAPANYFSFWFNAQQDAGPSPSAGARPGSISGPPAPSGLSHDPPGHLVSWGTAKYPLGKSKEMTWIQLEGLQRQRLIGSAVAGFNHAKITTKTSATGIHQTSLMATG